MLPKETPHSAAMYQSQHLTILFPPLMKMVTALEFWHCSMRSILSLVVPKEISRTTPAKPSFSAVSSQKRGTMRPPVAMAINWSQTDMTYFNRILPWCLSENRTNGKASVKCLLQKVILLSLQNTSANVLFLQTA